MGTPVVLFFPFLVVSLSSEYSEKGTLIIKGLLANLGGWGPNMEALLEFHACFGSGGFGGLRLRIWAYCTGPNNYQYYGSILLVGSWYPNEPQNDIVFRAL